MTGEGLQSISMSLFSINYLDWFQVRVMILDSQNQEWVKTRD